MGDTARIAVIAFEFPLPQLSEHGRRTGRLVARALELVPDDSLVAGRLHAFHRQVLGLADGDYPSDRDSLNRALVIARREGDAALEKRTLISAAHVELWYNHFDDALKTSLMTIDLAVAGSDPRAEVQARYWASFSSSFLARRKRSCAKRRR